jgi:hypothetical protein
MTARMKAHLAKLDNGVFSEGHRIEPKIARKIPKDLIGKCLSSRQASVLLKRLSTSGSEGKRRRT